MNIFNSRIVITPKIRKRTKYFLVLNILAICIIISLSLFYNDIKYSILIFGIIGIIILNSFFDGMYENPKHYLKGSLVITKDKIEFNDNIFTIKSLENIKIFYDSFDKERIKTGTYSYRTSNGIDNYIEFVFNSTVYKIQFYMKSEIEYENLRAVLLDWYYNEYSFYEGFELGRTYLLKSLDYKEIQILNEKIRRDK